MRKRTHSLFVTALTVATFVGSANATVISEDFEGTVAPGIPAGWTLINSGGNGAYATGVGTGNPGQSGNFIWNAASQTAPGIYLVNSGAAFDANQPISGSFQYFLEEVGRIDDMRINFVMGDVQNGIDGNAGEFINFYGNERTFGRRAQLRDGDGTVLFDGGSDNQYRIDSNQWETATFTWTPTGVNTGDFSISWSALANTPLNRGPMTVTGYTFDSPEIFFGFGTGRDLVITGGDGVVRIDNILIEGSEITSVVVPEPATAALGLIGLAGLMMRRRRMA